MKKFLLPILLLGNLTFMNLASAGCAEKYNEKFEKIFLHGSVTKNLAEFGKAGIGLYGGALLLWPVSPILGAAGGTIAYMSYRQKGQRMHFFDTLITNAHHFVQDSKDGLQKTESYIPTQTKGIRAIGKNRTLFQRLESKLLKVNPDLTRDAILEAIARADEKEDFCHSLEGEKALKTSLRRFSRVILKNL